MTRGHSVAVALVFALATLASGAEECVGDSCPVPEGFAAGPEAPDFEVVDAKDTDGDVDDAELAEFDKVEKEAAAAGTAEKAAKEAKDTIGSDKKSEETAPPKSKLGQSKVLNKEAAAQAAAADEEEEIEGAWEAETVDPNAFKAQAAAAKAAKAEEPKTEAPAAAAAETAAATPAATEAAPSVASTQASEEEEAPFDLDTELGLVRVMAQMGAVGTMMDVLVNATFKLGDANKDAKLTRDECKAFIANHIAPEDSKLGAALGLRGGHIAVDDAAAVDKVLDGIYSNCDSNKDGVIDHSEARMDVCKNYLHEQLKAVNQLRMKKMMEEREAAAGAAGGGGGPAEDTAGMQERLQEFVRRQQQQQQAAAAAGAGGAQQQAAAAQGKFDWRTGEGAPGGGAAAAGGGGGGGGGSMAEKFFSGLSNSGGGGAAGSGAAANPLQREIDRRIKSVQQMIVRNIQDPNVNTMLGGLGLVAFILRELLSANLFNMREVARPMVGSNIADFNQRLLHVALLSSFVAMFGNFG